MTGDVAICREPASGALAALSSNLVFGTGTLEAAVDGASFTFTGPNGTSTHVLSAPGQYFFSAPSPDDAADVEGYFTTVTSPISMTSTVTVASTAVCNTVDGTATWTYVGP